jgi:hypothetical protein
VFEWGDKGRLRKQKEEIIKDRAAESENKMRGDRVIHRKQVDLAVMELTCL